MLLKTKTIFLLAFISNALYASDWAIEKRDKNYILKKDDKVFELVYNGTPELNESKEESGFYIIDYFSGEFGTTQKTSITRRIVISKKSMQKVADDILSVRNGKNSIKSKWNFDYKNKVIKVYDPDLDLTKKYTY